MDSKLSWEKHIKEVKTKISKVIGILIKARRFFKISTLVTIYYSLVYSHLIYCIELWGKANKTILDPLNKIQKKTIRIITSTSPRSSSLPLFKRLNILPLNKIYEYHVAIFMFKFQKGLLPSALKEMFTQTNNVHTYFTRNRNNLYSQMFNKEFFKKSLCYNGRQIWNCLPLIFRECASIEIFKKNLRRQFLLEL